MRDRFSGLLAGVAAVVGAAAAIVYAQRGLTLSHYDAKAHLVVARRVLDSLTPEYSQIGAVWLPLPHLVNLLPVQIDAFYRTGASAVLFSLLSFALACYAIARLSRRVTGSRWAAATGVAIFALDPNVLYLQATPMTEPMLLGLTLLGVARLCESVEAGVTEGRRDAGRAGWLFALACLTRYEAWIVTAAALPLAAAALARGGAPLGEALRRTLLVGRYPAIAIVAFFVHSWYTTGAWFVTGGFFVADNAAQGDPWRALTAVVYGMRTLLGRVVVYAAWVAAALLLWRGLRRASQASSLVPLALLGFLVLPAYAFFEGHPFRMRYMVAPATAAAVLAGIGLGLLPRWPRAIAGIAALAWLLATAQPFTAAAPVVAEAQWDVPFSRGRENVTRCLMRGYGGELILASMGSLAHYMQELSHEGLEIKNFVHEGNLPHWQEAIESPRGRVGWILVEERAEGGDLLAARARASSAFLTGFERICADGGVALYRATAVPAAIN